LTVKTFKGCFAGKLTNTILVFEKKAKRAQHFSAHQPPREARGVAISLLTLEQSATSYGSKARSVQRRKKSTFGDCIIVHDIAQGALLAGRQGVHFPRPASLPR